MKPGRFPLANAWANAYVRLMITLAMSILAVVMLWRTYSDTGLFQVLAGDYNLYFSQATVLRSDPGAIYDLDARRPVFKQLIDTYTWDRTYDAAADKFLWMDPVPYPPLFAWLFTPFTLVSPPAGFALWTGFNLIISGAVAWRLSQAFFGLDRWSVALFFLASYPVVLTLAMGQIQLLIGFAVTECFLSLRARHDFRAGLWMGCLLLKPQYGVLLGLLMIWKRRWRTVVGVSILGMAILMGSISVAGLQALMAFPHSFSQFAQFYGGEPGDMLNWRSIVLDLRPGIGVTKGIVITLFLSLATVAAVAWVWRGPWGPEKPDFSVKILLILIATLMVAHHSKPYGALILAMPLCAMLAEGLAGQFSRAIIMIGTILPALTFTLGYSDRITVSNFWPPVGRAAEITKLCIFALFSVLMFEIWRQTRRA